jgi:VWFA-related protein
MLRPPAIVRESRPWASCRLCIFITIGVMICAFGIPAQTSPQQEIASRDVQPTFKLQAERNLVMVRVVVRDGKGAIVDNLRKEDFQVFDHGKLQAVVQFSLEKPAQQAAARAAQKPEAKPAVEPEAEDESTVSPTTARRFVAIYFDDVNTTFENLARSRDAADHFLTGHVAPGDRVALYTSSGQKQLDFTDDLAKIHEALLELRPRPIIGQDTSCGAVPPYEAYLIIEQQDATAIQVAADEIMNCNPCPATTPAQQQQCLTQAQTEVQSYAMHALTASETEANAALRGIESIVRHLTSLPGQRSLVIVSQGFLTETLRFELSQITDRALRSGVILNAIDARGLYTDPVTSDASQRDYSASMNSAFRGQKSQMLMESARRETDGMQSLALDTGGIFFNNSNDLEAGFRKTAGLPEAFYILAFSPQNLKLDGNFHPIQVKLVARKGFSVQARKGYYAPRKPTDPTAQEKEELQEAIFSQDETRELPVDVHTQFFMKDETDARITVLTHVDLRPLHFRKEEDRNVDKLTFLAVAFDRDGHEVTGLQKTVELRLRDSSMERLLQTGITIRTALDVKPGTYLVRAVVRDSESGQISGLNRTVEIPY